MTVTSRIALATLEELWWRGGLVERRLSHGQASESDGRIIATDERDPFLVAQCEAAIAAMRRLVIPDARVRLIAHAGSDGNLSHTVIVSIGGRSIVTTPEHAAADVQWLRDVVREATVQAENLPLLWKYGTAAVLLHEAAGHPVEHGLAPLPVPHWLTVDAPLQMRRASFRDVPLLRMTTVTVRQHEAPFAIPDERLEIALVDGGRYDPLTDLVTLHIGAADVVRGDDVRRAAPFDIVASRAQIARSFAGAAGEPLRYPGVICSREGQELVVWSLAPVLLTEPL